MKCFVLFCFVLFCFVLFCFVNIIFFFANIIFYIKNVKKIEMLFILFFVLNNKTYNNDLKF